MADRTEWARAWYAQDLRLTAPIRSTELYSAFATVPRERFMGPGPWTLLCRLGAVKTPDANPAHLYHNVLVQISAERGINNGDPVMWARSLDILNLRIGEAVVHVGAGTGYYTAIMAECVGGDGQVVAAEVESDLAARARQALVPWPNAQVVDGTGFHINVACVDAIIVSAGMSQIPRQWLDGLNPGGRLLLPLTTRTHWPLPRGRGDTKGAAGGMLLVVKAETGFKARFLSPAAFIPCQGGISETTETLLGQALDTGGMESVRSLRRAPEQPDASAWLVGEDWWLSTNDV